MLFLRVKGRIIFVSLHEFLYACTSGVSCVYLHVCLHPGACIKKQAQLKPHSDGINITGRGGELNIHRAL